MLSTRSLLLLGAASLLVVTGDAPLIAQNNPLAVQQSRTTVRPPAATQAPAAKPRVGYRRHGQYRGARPPVTQRNPNRHLISSLGSAANVRVGGYQQYYGNPDQQHGAAPLPIGGGYYPPAYVVYVDTVVEPPIYGQSRVEPEPAPQPPPITIINQLPPDPMPTGGGVVAEAPITALPPVPEPRRPRSTEPQSVFLDIRPADASIFLDDEPLGTAIELTNRDPLTLPPGVYVLEVTHPAFKSQRLVFGVDDEDGVHVVVDLTASKPTRRTRVR